MTDPLPRVPSFDAWTLRANIGLRRAVLDVSMHAAEHHPDALLGFGRLMGFLTAPTDAVRDALWPCLAEAHIDAGEAATWACFWEQADAMRWLTQRGLIAWATQREVVVGTPDHLDTQALEREDFAFFHAHGVALMEPDRAPLLLGRVIAEGWIAGLEAVNAWPEQWPLDAVPEGWRRHWSEWAMREGANRWDAGPPASPVALALWHGQFEAAEWLMAHQQGPRDAAAWQGVHWAALHALEALEEQQQQSGDPAQAWAWVEQAVAHGSAWGNPMAGNPERQHASTPAAWVAQAIAEAHTQQRMRVPRGARLQQWMAGWAPPQADALSDWLRGGLGPQTPAQRQMLTWLQATPHPWGAEQPWWATALDAMAVWAHEGVKPLEAGWQWLHANAPSGTVPLHALMEALQAEERLATLEAFNAREGQRWWAQMAQWTQRLEPHEQSAWAAFVERAKACQAVCFEGQSASQAHAAEEAYGLHLRMPVTAPTVRRKPRM